MGNKKTIIFYAFLLEVMLFVVCIVLVLHWNLVSFYYVIFYNIIANIFDSLGSNNVISLNVPAYFTVKYGLIITVLVFINSTKWLLMYKVYKKGFKKSIVVVILGICFSLLWISRINDWGS